MMEILVDDEYALLKVDWIEGVPTLHLVMHKWSHTIFKQYVLPMWAQVLEYLKEQGAHAVCAVIRSDEYKIAKFHRVMGMHEAYNDGEYIINRRWL